MGGSPFAGLSTSDITSKPAVQTFITRYICANSSTTCSQFQDPNGTEYKFNLKKAAKSTSTSTGITATTTDNNIYIFQYSAYGDTENTVASRNGTGDIALFYVGESGNVMCADV